MAPTPRHRVVQWRRASGPLMTAGGAGAPNDGGHHDIEDAFPDFRCSHGGPGALDGRRRTGRGRCYGPGRRFRCARHRQSGRRQEGRHVASGRRDKAGQLQPVRGIVQSVRPQGGQLQSVRGCCEPVRAQGGQLQPVRGREPLCRSESLRRQEPLQSLRGRVAIVGVPAGKSGATQGPDVTLQASGPALKSMIRVRTSTATFIKGGHDATRRFSRHQSA
jgi:hypothetical protein